MRISSSDLLALALLVTACELPTPCVDGCLDVPVNIDPMFEGDLEVANAVFGPANMRFVDDRDGLIHVELGDVPGSARGKFYPDGCEVLIVLEPSRGELLLAHELGHVVGLGHTRSRRRVMFKNANRGYLLTADEISIAVEVTAYSLGVCTELDPD